MIGSPFLLFMVFMILKLTEVIDWSWWLVTAPLWAGFLLPFLLSLVVGIYKFWDIAEAAEQVKRRHEDLKRRR